MRGGGPSDDDITRGLQLVIDEVEMAFKTDKWALWSMNDARLADLEAAAALQHCCVLAREVIAAYDRDADAMGRLATRSLVESFLVGLFVHHGGVDARDELIAAYATALRRMQNAAAEHDEQLERRREEVASKNAVIERNNAGKRLWNERNPHLPPKPEDPLLDSVDGVLLDLDLSPALDLFSDVVDADINYADLPHRIIDASEESGTTDDARVVYLLAYRALSTVGAHPTHQVLQSYFDARNGSAWFWRVQPIWALPSMKSAALATCAVLVALLTIRVMEKRGLPCPAAHEVFTMFQTSEERGDRPDDESP